MCSLLRQRLEGSGPFDARPCLPPEARPAPRAVARPRQRREAPRTRWGPASAGREIGDWAQNDSPGDLGVAQSEARCNPRDCALRAGLEGHAQRVSGPYRVMTSTAVSNRSAAGLRSSLLIPYDRIMVTVQLVGPRGRPTKIRSRLVLLSSRQRSSDPRLFRIMLVAFNRQTREATERGLIETARALYVAVDQTRHALRLSVLQALRTSEHLEGRP